MLLKTVQPLYVIEQLKNNKNVIYSYAKTEIDENGWLFYEAYEWLKNNKMAEIGTPSPTNQLFWAWEHNTPKNIRETKKLLKFQKKNYREDYVILTIEKPNNEILLSDHSLWEYVLNYWLIPDNEADSLNWEKLENEKGINFYKDKPLKDEHYHQLLSKSWDKAFQLKLNNKTGNYNFDLRQETLDVIGIKKEDCLVQATFWDIKKEEIQDIQIFKS